MRNQNASKAKNDSWRDFRESWKLLKSNYRTLLGIELFGIGSSLLIAIALMAIWFQLEPNFVAILSQDFIQSISFRMIVVSISLILVTTFINCQTGLAFDVMSSGEMFTEFKSAFNYFRQHWWKYIIISAMMGGLGLSMNFTSQPGNPQHQGISFVVSDTLGFVMILVRLVIEFLWYCLIVQSLASINAQGQFVPALRESFRIFKANPKRILSTWGLYYLIFIMPAFLFEIILGFINPPLESLRFLVVLFITLYATLVIFIGLPLRALLATGLYNNVEFKRFPQKTKLS